MRYNTATVSRQVLDTSTLSHFVDSWILCVGYSPIFQHIWVCLWPLGFVLEISGLIL